MSNHTHRMRAHGRSWIAAGALLLACATPAFGFSPETAAPLGDAALEAPASPQVETVLHGAAATEDRARPTLMQRITERLRRLPFRPVMIGETPRTPEDPEPGAGMTIFIQF